MSRSITETNLRNVLVAALDWHRHGEIVLSKWWVQFAELRKTQAHYSQRESKAIQRLLAVHHSAVGIAAVRRARERLEAANTKESHARIVECIRSHSYEKRNVSGAFWCVLCNSGSHIHYHVDDSWKISALCDNRNCLRLLQSPTVQRKPRFANIIPQDIGTFLVMSEADEDIFYAVDCIERTCSCDDFKFRASPGPDTPKTSNGHLCKHICECDAIVFQAMAF